MAFLLRYGVFIFRKRPPGSLLTILALRHVPRATKFNLTGFSIPQQLHEDVDFQSVPTYTALKKVENVVTPRGKKS